MFPPSAPCRLRFSSLSFSLPCLPHTTSPPRLLRAPAGGSAAPARRHAVTRRTWLRQEYARTPLSCAAAAATTPNCRATTPTIRDQPNRLQPFQRRSFESVGGVVLPPRTGGTTRLVTESRTAGRRARGGERHVGWLPPHEGKCGGLDIRTRTRAAGMAAIKQEIVTHVGLHVCGGRCNTRHERWTSLGGGVTEQGQGVGGWVGGGGNEVLRAGY